MDFAPMDGNDPSAELDKLCDARRGAFPAEKQPLIQSGRWGLALSGGGIRSATFCLGLIKALSANRAFHRFDYLSTVSGGGYTGSMVGKLFEDRTRTLPPDPLAVEKALATCETRWFAAWLRSNGRYLTPRGAKDTLFAAASYARNLLGVHVEMALLCLLLGCMLAEVDLLVWGWADCIASGQSQCFNPFHATRETFATLSHFPTLWVVLPVLAWVGGVLACAYWASPSRLGEPVALQRWVTCGLALAGLWYLSGLPRVNPGSPPLAVNFELVLPGWLVDLAAAVLTSWILGTLLVWSMIAEAGDPDRMRHRLTAGLAMVMRLALVVVALGLVDRLAWSAAGGLAAQQGALALVLSLAAVGLRAALPKMADLPKSLAPVSRRVLLETVNVAGLALAALAVVFWVSLVHRAVSSDLFTLDNSPPRFGKAWQWIGILGVPPSVLVIASWWNTEFLNRSSLYTFYRARLIRSYLGAANQDRLGGAAAASGVIGRSADEVASVSVSDVHSKDDVSMAAYNPHLRGGPVHLLNVCVNQTRSANGGIFNQDRKGILMTVGPGGLMRVGGSRWMPATASGSMTLGSWMAISGAAVAPGLGGSTRPGIAALLMLAGIRLGYWWDASALGTRDKNGRAAMSVNKYGQFVSELCGRFDGDQGRRWFLSDGGHFENTAAYALLREQCELVVVADCGADPRYAFGDLENLVRKARIDLQAEVVFLRPNVTHSDSPASFGSLNDLVAADSQACLALARVNYKRSGRTGYLILVKPNMSQGTPVDLVNFKADNPLFPQEPTTDQSFSEAQWESYFQLGKTLGNRIDLRQLEDIEAFATRHFADDDGARLVRDFAGKQRVVSTPKRLSSRIAATGVVSATFSLGAAATIGLAAWQAVDSKLTSRAAAVRISPTSFKELTDLFGKVPVSEQSPSLPFGLQSVNAAVPARAASAPPDPHVAEMAIALLRVAAQDCNDDNREAFRSSGLMALMLERTKFACRNSPPAHPSCDRLTDDDSDNMVACLQKSPRKVCAPKYWIRDYSVSDKNLPNCMTWDSKEVAAAAATKPSPTLTPISSRGIFASLVAFWELDSRTSSPSGPAGTASGPAMSASGPQLPASAAAVAAAASTPSSPTPCDGFTVNLQIYGPASRELARQLRVPWRGLGASVPAIVDIWDQADKRHLPRPALEPGPVIAYRSPEAETCARALVPKGDGNWSVKMSSDVEWRALQVYLPPRESTGVRIPETAYCYQEDDLSDATRHYGMHCHSTEAVCRIARGDNPRTLQSDCKKMENLPAFPYQRGFAGSWYLLSNVPFSGDWPQFKELDSKKRPKAS